MDDDREDMPEDGAARAFTQLGREVALLRAAIEGLAAARDSIEIPDYEPTLLRTEDVLADLAEKVDALGKKPAMTLTPENLGHRLNDAVGDATRELRHQIGVADTTLRNAARDLSDRAASARLGEEQTMWLLGAGLGGLGAGLLLYALMGGPIARLAPASWQWPERVAMRVLDEPTLSDAGQHLMRAANPDGWRAIVAAAILAKDNRAAIDRCQEQAAKAKKAVRCTIDVKAAE